MPDSIAKVVFIAVGVYLWYPAVSISASINDLSDVNPFHYWRFMLCCFISSTVSLLIVSLVFPGTKWKILLYIGTAIGVSPGLIIGWIRQLLSREVLSKYLHRVVLIISFFSVAYFLSVFCSSVLHELSR